MTHPADTPRPRSRAWALAVLPLTAGLLAGCGAYQGEQEPGGSEGSGTPAGHPDVGSGASRPDAAGKAGGDGEGPSSGTGEEARPDQRAAAAAAERAASFGFTEQAVATEEQVAELRQDVRLRQSNTTGTRVDPAECKSALTAVDWSPLLAEGSGASRVDVGSPTFQGTGTVEVAALEDGAVVDQHVQNVERLVQECGELTFTLDGTFTGEGGVSTFELTSSVPEAADLAGQTDQAEQGEQTEQGSSVESALQWTRTPVSGSGSPATAQVLMGRSGEHAVMVSFIGSSPVADPEFTTMARAMLDAALAELSEQP